MKKKCNHCNKIKPSSEYHRHARSSSGLQVNCKSCNGLLAKKWSAANPNSRRRNLIRSNLKYWHGISPEFREDLLKNQSGKCASCGSRDILGHKMHIDHDHKSGKIRAILCNGCNTGTGLKDDINKLAMKIVYLSIHGKRLSRKMREALSQL